MITVRKFVFNDFQVNTFLVSDETKECLIIDPGCYSVYEKNELRDYCEKNDLIPVKLINTHGHIDHILGNIFIKESYNIPAAAHKSDQNYIKGFSEQGQMFGYNVDDPGEIDEFLEDGDIVKFGASELKVLNVPGHSMGSIALYSAEQRFLIAGDILFNGSIGRTDLPGGDYDTIINSIKTKILTLPRDVTVYPGHGPSTTIGYEIDTNPFLR
jgi:hydroxyacylglutathione hydrolase